MWRRWWWRRLSRVWRTVRRFWRQRLDRLSREQGGRPRWYRVGAGRCLNAGFYMAVSQALGSSGSLSPPPLPPPLAHPSPSPSPSPFALTNSRSRSLAFRQAGGTPLGTATKSRRSEDRTRGTRGIGRGRRGRCARPSCFSPALIRLPCASVRAPTPHPSTPHPPLRRRFDKVQAKLAEQEERIAAYRKGIIDQKPKPGIVNLYKRLMTMRGGSK